MSAFLWGCATAPLKKDILAMIDGEPITQSDLEYALQVEHRREDLSSASALDIPAYVERLVNEKLIIQESRRMGLHKNPAVEAKVRAYIIRESVTRLYKDEILDKVTVSDEEIVRQFKEDNEKFILDILEFNTEEDAAGVLVNLRAGDSFANYIKMYPASFHKQEGENYTFTRKTLGSAIKDAIVSLRPGETSDVIQIGEKYYIINLIGTEEAPDEELARHRGSLESSVKQQKIKDRSKEYVIQLREKAGAKIDRELLSSMTLDNDEESRKKWLEDARPIVELNGSVLTAGQLAAMVPPGDEEAKEKAINRWLDNKVVDNEALSRHYDETTDLKDMVRRYQDQIIRKVFTNQIILPKIKITDEEMEQYYMDNKEKYLKPSMYKIQQITSSTFEEAEEILKNLQGGASFSWLARTKSTDSVSPMGGFLGWRKKEQLSGPVSDIIESLKPGDISPVLNDPSGYIIVRLQEKSGGEVEEFSRVKNSVHRLVFEEKFSELYGEYVGTLKKEAQVDIKEDAIRAFEKRFKNN